MIHEIAFGSRMWAERFLRGERSAPPPPPLKHCLHHRGYLSNPHQLGSSQCRGQKRGKSHVPIALPRQHKGMLDWAAASEASMEQRCWEESKILPHVTPRAIVSPPLSLSLSLLWSLLLVFSPRRWRCATRHRAWNQIALSRLDPAAVGRRLGACLCVCRSARTLAKKLYTI